MSQNYKIIREFKKVAESLIDEGMGKTKIMHEAGITHTCLTEILEYDPVSVKIHKPTIEKLQAFIDTHKKEEPKEPSMPTLNREGLLGELSRLINDFQAVGYKLDVNITRTYKPE